MKGLTVRTCQLASCHQWVEGEAVIISYYSGLKTRNNGEELEGCDEAELEAFCHSNTDWDSFWSEVLCVCDGLLENAHRSHREQLEV